MKVLGIESSCDECAASIVEDGRVILSNIIATQIPFHEKYSGVVPEIASRKHTEWIQGVVEECLEKANLSANDIDGIACTNRPGLIGSLLVGFSFAKSYAWALNKPFVAVNHILAHLYAPHLEYDIAYPYIGLLVSGGHTLICKIDGFDKLTVMGTTIDDAVGEAFDKVAKFYNLGYPGGVIIDRLAKEGDPKAFNFPKSQLKGDHRYDFSYSGLKTACINQLEQFRNEGKEVTNANIAASFQKTAVDMLLSKLFLACEDTGIKTIVAGGGVAANSHLRALLSEKKEYRVMFPSLNLCTDNGAMIAGIGYEYLKRGETSPLETSVSARVSIFRKK